MDRICENCEFWERRGGPEEPTGHCRRFPPSSDIGWAITVADDWCGEYESKDQTQPRRGDPSAFGRRI